MGEKGNGWDEGDLYQIPRKRRTYMVRAETGEHRVK
jgi:hypothetical protein